MFESAVPVAALLFAALCMNFSWVHMWQDSDSILLSLISTVRWTPFYWGDHRYGMPLPYAASWIHDPVWNLLFQCQFFSLATVGVVLIGNLFFLHGNGADRSVRLGTACFALVIAFLIYRPTLKTAQTYFLAHPYVISLLPLLLAVAVVFRAGQGGAPIRLLVSMPLLFLSLWINYSHVVVAGLFAIFTPSRSARWRHTLPMRIAFAAASAAIFGAVRAWAKNYPSLGEPGFAPDQWWNAVCSLWETTTRVVVQPVAMLILIGMAVAAGWFWRRRGVLDAGDGILFSGCALLFAAAIAASDWPMKNGFEARYWTTPLVLILLVATAWVARAGFAVLERLVRSRSIASSLAALILVVTSLIVFRAPNPVWTRNLVISSAAAKWGPDALRLGCTHMVGAYAVAWMTMFYARATGHDMWAVAPRAEVIRDLWDKPPNESRRYCGDMRDVNAISSSFVLFGIELLPAKVSAGRTVRFESASSKGGSE